MLETREQQAFVAGTAPCFLCDGFVEPELHRFHPGADVCLDCMSADELQGLQEDLNHAQRVSTARFCHGSRRWTAGSSTCTTSHPGG